MFRKSKNHDLTTMGDKNQDSRFSNAHRHRMWFGNPSDSAWQWKNDGDRPNGIKLSGQADFCNFHLYGSRTNKD
jgi:hypothetical protein